MSSAPAVPGSPAAGGWRSLLRGNIGALALISLLNDLASEMIYPLLPLFLVGTLGASAGFLGVVEGVAESLSSLLKLAGGWLSDRVGRRKPLVVWGYGIATFARPLIALATAPWHVLAVRVADRTGKGMRTAPRDALLAASVHPSRRGAAFGAHRAADHLGAILGPLLASGLLLLLPGRIRLVFALALVPGLIAIAIAVVGVRETTSEDAAAGGTALAEGTPGGDVPAASPGVAGTGLSPVFARYLAVLALFTLGNASDAFLLLRARELGVAAVLIPVLWAVLHVSKSAWSVPGGALADRLGARRVIVAGWAVYAAVYAGFALAGAAWHAWALFAVYGLFYGLTESPEKVLVARLAPASLRGRAFGVYHFAIGVTVLPASVIFGAIWDAFGSAAAFGLGAGVAVLAAALLPFALPRSTPATA